MPFLSIDLLTKAKTLADLRFGGFRGLLPFVFDFEEALCLRVAHLCWT